MTTFAEMGSFLRTLGHELTEEEVVTMVQRFDTDGSGDIDEDELISGLGSAGEVSAGARARPGAC